MFARIAGFAAAIIRGTNARIPWKTPWTLISKSLCEAFRSDLPGDAGSLDPGVLTRRSTTAVR